VAVPAPAGSGKGVGGDPQPLTAAAAVSSPSAEGGAADGKSSVGGQGQQDPGIVGHKSGDAEGVAGAGVGVRDPQRDEGDETRLRRRLVVVLIITWRLRTATSRIVQNITTCGFIVDRPIV